MREVSLRLKTAGDYSCSGQEVNSLWDKIKMEMNLLQSNNIKYRWYRKRRRAAEPTVGKSTNMAEFTFENTVMLTESQYLAVWGVLTKRPKMIRLVGLTGAGVLFLFTKVTLLLGLLVLGLVVVILFAPDLLSFGARSTFRQHKHLRDALTYGVNDQKLWVKGTRIDANVPWSALVTWRESEGWLVLSPSGIPPLYLSLGRLKNEGLYGRVRALAASNAPEFNTSTPGTS